MRAGILAILFLLVGALQVTPGAGVPEAHAQSYANCGPSNGSQIQCATIEDAYNACMARVAAVNGWGCKYSPGYFQCFIDHDAGGPCGGGANSGYTWATVCPSGTTWKGAPTFQCVSSQRCLDHNNDPGFAGMGPVPRTWTTYCPASSCELVMDSPETTTVGSTSIYRGTLRYTGTVCGATTTAPKDDTLTEPKKQTCAQVSGQNVCIKPNGDHCYSGPIGRPMQFCWRAGETGQKTSADVVQARGPGTTTPAGTPPAGDTLNPADSPMQSTTQLSSGVTVVTSVQNYTTASGTDAGTVDQAENPDGQDGGSGDGGGDSTASGGGDCKTAPIVSDPALAMVATQAWATRCAVEAGNAVKVTGDVANCAEPFTVEGSDANAVKLRALRATICKGDADGDGQPDWTKPDGTESGDGDEANDVAPGVIGINLNVPSMIDPSGWLSGFGSVPPLGTLDFGPFGQHSMDQSTWWPNLVNAIHALMLLLGAWVSVQILLRL